MSTNVKAIIKNHLVRNGYAGLHNERLECWCAIGEDDKFCTCEDIPVDCQPGFKILCENCKEDCFDSASGSCPEASYCIKEKGNHF